VLIKFYNNYITKEDYMYKDEWLKLEGNKHCPQCGCMAGYYQDPEAKMNYCSGICAQVYKENNKK